MSCPQIRKPGIIKQKPTFEPIPNNINKQNNKKCDRMFCLNLSQMSLTNLPSQYAQIQTTSISQLCLNYNSIHDCLFDTQVHCRLVRLEIMNNGMKKFGVRRMGGRGSCCQLRYLDLSQNCLQFIDISQLTNIQTLNLSHNNLQTIIIPHQRLKHLDISNNKFSNIQYSVLNSKIFPNLQKLLIKDNKKSLYDIILSINGEQLLPNLKQLDCSDNMVSYIQGLSVNLEILDVQRNQMIFDRAIVNQLCRLKKAKIIRIGGNVVGRGFIQIIREKIGEGVRIVQGKENGNQRCDVKESPYRIHTENGKIQNRQTQKATYSNFTLGQDLIEETQVDQQNIDPDYNLLQQTPTLAKQEKGFNTVGNEEAQEGQRQYEQTNCQEKALRETQNRLKVPKFKLKIEGQRYHNHYRQYFNQLAHFMIIPPHPIMHSLRHTSISTRIDPPTDPDYLNEFQLLNEMYKSRGGIHYVRKVFNWHLTQMMSDAAIVFLNVQMSKKDFQALCSGDYRIVDKGVEMKHVINLQPSSFSCYHLLARVNNGLGEAAWSCFYLIEAVHL